MEKNMTDKEEDTNKEELETEENKQNELEEKLKKLREQDPFIYD